MDDWRSYDGVAETYERVHAARFAEAARDLVGLLAIGDGAKVLDVGTGTGAGAEQVLDAGARVVGVDRSLGMLAVGHRARPSIPLAAGEVIDLPFRDRTFDAVVGNFVLAHFVKVETALYAHPGVAEASVFGLPCPVYGEVPVAVWLGKPAATVESEDLRAFLAERLAPFKIPVRFWREPQPLPRLGTEKIDKRALKAKYAAGWDPLAETAVGSARG